MALSGVEIIWPTGEILIPRTGMTLIQSTPTEIRELNLNEFRLALKDLEDSPEGITWLKTHNHNTEVTLGGIVYARIIEILDPYTITFENGYYAVNLVGANSNVGDKININNVSVRSNNSAGLISSPLIEYAAFEGGVWYDEVNGTPGTVFPIGAHLQPAKFLSDVKLIADYRGFNVVYIVGDANIDSGIDFNEFIFEGQTHVNNQVNVLPSANVFGSVFRDLTVTGTLDGGNEITNSIVSGLTYVNGHIHNCGLVGTISLAGNMDAIIANCITLDPYNPPVIDMGGSGQNLVLPNYSGLLTITNFNYPTGFIGIGMNAGETKLDSTSVLAGTIQIAGVGTLLDENDNPIRSGLWNGGVTIINSLMSKETVAEAVEQEIGTEIQYSVFNGKVWVDTNIGVSGTTYPAGSQIAPSNNLTDAVAIAIGRGFTTIHFLTNYTFDSSVNISDFTLEGDSKQKTFFTFNNPYLIRCTLKSSYCTGILTGIIGFENTHLYNVSSTSPIPTSQTIIIQDSIIQGTLQVPSEYTGTAEFLNCWAIPDSDNTPPQINFNGCGGNLQVRNLSGFVILTNITNPLNDVRIFLHSGGIELTPSVTSGNFRFTGTGNLVNNSTSTLSLDTDALISKFIISDAVEESIGNEIQFAAFNSQVTIDSINGVTGTTYPIGTSSTPVNNLLDAKQILSERGFNKIFVIGELTIGTGEDISNLIFETNNWNIITLEDGVISDETSFKKTDLRGELSGSWNVLENCWITDVSNFAGWVIGGSIENLSLAPWNDNSNGENFIDDIVPMYPGVISILNMNEDTHVAITELNGDIEIRNSVSGCSIDAGLLGGTFIINSGCTGGDIVVRGVGELINNSLLSVNNTGLMSQDTVSEAVWDEPVTSHLIGGTTGKALGNIQFGGKIHINPLNGITGTTFPAGTERTPVNNLADAKAIAIRENINIFDVISNLTLVTGDNIGGYSFTSSNHATIEVQSGAITFYTSFFDVNLKGTLNGYTIIQRGSIDSDGISEFYGLMEDVIQNGNITVSSDNTKNAIIVDHTVGNVSTPAQINLNGDGAKLSLRGLTGGVLITNKTGTTQNVFIDLYSARVGFDSTVTAGNITVRGVGYIYLDESTNTTFDTQGLIGQNTVAQAVWDEPLTEHVIAGTTGRALSLTQFAGKVWLDPINGYSGTTFPTGTQGYPVNNGPDSILIAIRENLYNFRIDGNFVTTTDLSDYTIEGDTFLDDGLTFNNNVYSNITFRDLRLDGVASFTGTEFKNCFIENINGISGEMFNCRLKDSIKVATGKTLSGIEMVIEGDNTTIDLGGVSGTTVSLDINSGYILFINSVEGCLIELNMKGGEIELDSSCTGGDFYAEGIGTLYGDPVALGMNVTGNNLIDNTTISGAVWNKQLP